MSFDTWTSDLNRVQLYTGADQSFRLVFMPSAIFLFSRYCIFNRLLEIRLVLGSEALHWWFYIACIELVKIKNAKIIWEIRWYRLGLLLLFLGSGILFCASPLVGVKKRWKEAEEALWRPCYGFFIFHSVASALFGFPRSRKDSHAKRKEEDEEEQEEEDGRVSDTEVLPVPWLPPLRIKECFRGFAVKYYFMRRN